MQLKKHCNKDAITVCASSRRAVFFCGRRKHKIQLKQSISLTMKTSAPPAQYKSPAFLHHGTICSSRQHPLQQFIPLKDLSSALKTACTHTHKKRSLTCEHLKEVFLFQYLFSYKRLKSPTWELRRLKREKTSESSHLGQVVHPSENSLAIRTSTFFWSHQIRTVLQYFHNIFHYW